MKPKEKAVPAAFVTTGYVQKKKKKKKMEGKTVVSVCESALFGYNSKTPMKRIHIHKKIHVDNLFTCHNTSHSSSSSSSSSVATKAVVLLWLTLAYKSKVSKRPNENLN